MRETHKTLTLNPASAPNCRWHLSAISRSQSGATARNLITVEKLKVKGIDKGEKMQRKVMKKSVALLATTLLISGAGISSASADAKSDYQAARTAFKASMVTYKAALATAHTNIEAARNTFKSAREAATTKEAKAAAKATFESAKSAAKAGIPTKPVKPVKPAQP